MNARDLATFVTCDLKYIKRHTKKLHDTFDLGVEDLIDFLDYMNLPYGAVYVDSKIWLGLIIKFKDKESYNHTVIELKKYFNTKEIDELIIAVTGGLIRWLLSLKHMLTL